MRGEKVKDKKLERETQYLLLRHDIFICTDNPVDYSDRTEDKTENSESLLDSDVLKIINGIPPALKLSSPNHSHEKILNKEQDNNNIRIHHFLCREKNKECLVRLE